MHQILKRLFFIIIILLLPIISVGVGGIGIRSWQFLELTVKTSVEAFTIQSA